MHAREEVEFLKRQQYRMDTQTGSSEDRAKYLNRLLSLSPQDQRAVVEAKADKDQLSAMARSLENRLNLNSKDIELKLMATVQLFRVVGLVNPTYITTLLRSYRSALPDMLDQIKSWQKENYKPPGLGVNSASLSQIQRQIEDELGYVKEVKQNEKATKGLPSLSELKEDLDFARQAFESYKMQFNQKTPQYNCIQTIIAVIEGGSVLSKNPDMPAQQKIKELGDLIERNNRLDQKNLGDITKKIQDDLLPILKSIDAIEKKQSVFAQAPASTVTLSSQALPISKNPSRFMNAQSSSSLTQAIEKSEYRICLIGNSGSGLSSLMSRLVNREETPLKTNGIDVGVRNISINQRNTKHLVKLNIWDAPVFNNSEVQGYLRGTKVYFLVCDLSKKESLQDIIEVYKRVADKNQLLYLVGTKADMPRMVSDKELHQLAAELKCPYKIVSSKTGQGIDDLMKETIQELLKPQIELHAQKGNKP